MRCFPETVRVYSYVLCKSKPSVNVTCKDYSVHSMNTFHHEKVKYKSINYNNTSRKILLQC